ncbi:MAG: hypothetical protein IKV89_03105 [Clostridia bacterium]|nr:hypothetical protein [Clostridia bacterium]
MNNKIKIVLFLVIGVISAEIYFIRPYASTLFMIAVVSVILGILVRR